MELQLKGKRALVTGSSSGIGAGIARVLAAEGARVVVHGRDATRAREVCEQLRSTGAQASVVLGDLATVRGCDDVGDTVMRELGGIDILVNNAGGRASSHRGGGEGGAVNPGWFEIPWTDWLWTIEQNLGAAVRLIHRFAPGMKERGWGRVIQISSASATQTVADLAEYQAVKAAMTNMTTSLAKTLSRTGVTVNTVTPGTITTPAVVRAYTDMAAKLGMDPNDWDAIERRFTSEFAPIEVDHFGVPEDIGRMVALIASPLSSFMTGSNYRVDGGQCRSIN
jgi:3-oxoacyl-[acyl-carrier protein] reductase